MNFKSLFKILSLVLVFSACNKQKQSSSTEMLFDSNWLFMLGDNTKARDVNFNTENWRKLDIPHDWSIEGKIEKTNPMAGAGGYFPSGIGWYRKQFNVPKSWSNKLVSVYFEGVYMNSEVYLNGKLVGKHPYGYTGFFLNLSPYLLFDKENTIAVRVDNSQQQNSRWYSGSGIFRHVWLNVTNKIHIANWGVQVSTFDISAEMARVQVKTKLQNETDQNKNVVINTQLYNQEGLVLRNKAISLEILPNSEKEFKQTIFIEKPKLWSPDTPYLYHANVKITLDNRVIDEKNIPFGIRSIKFSAQSGFQLNGKKLKINGGCVHHDNGCLGAAAYDRAEERKVELLKEAGFNAVRTSHNPPSEYFLDACDKYGLLVMDETFDCWEVAKTTFDYAQYFNDWWQRDVDAMVLRDMNHPSVIIWSIGNEIPERKELRAVNTAKKMVEYIHAIDNSRPVTSAVCGWGEWVVFDSLFAAHDIAGYNYQMGKATSDHNRVPDRIIVHTESYPADAFVNWEFVQNNNYIIGDFVWTAMDYLGESGVGRAYYPDETPGEHWEGDFYPWHGAYCGDIDLIGWRKPISHYRSMLYNGKEMLYMAVCEPNPEEGAIKLTQWAVWPTWESWTWPGHEEKDLKIEVYSLYEKVRLYLNNMLVGEKPTTIEQQFKTSFIIPYQPGVLRLTGVMGENEIETTVLRTAGIVNDIKLKADRNVILANGQDLSYVYIELTDKEGVLQPNANNLLRFDVSGPGVIAGVDNANLKDTALYVNNKRNAWHGRALVIIKSTHESGEITLSVKSDELKESKIKITTIK